MDRYVPRVGASESSPRPKQIHCRMVQCKTTRQDPSLEGVDNGDIHKA